MPERSRRPRFLGIAERIEHHEIAAYFAAISLAKSLGYATAANLLVESLQQEQKAAELLKKLSKPLLKEAVKVETSN